MLGRVANTRLSVINLLRCFVLILTAEALQAATTIYAVDRNGAPFPSVLVIIKSLEGAGEIGRYITDDDGKIAPVELGGGLYRIIATCPFGSCDTTVREVFGVTLGARFRLQLPNVGPARTRILVLDDTGAPFPGVLVIITSLPGNTEIGRYLSGRDGRVPSVILRGERYRIVATCPYGFCATLTREVSGSDLAAELRLNVHVKATDLEGELVDSRRISLMVEIDRRDTSVAHLLVRDPQALREVWYTLAAGGTVNVTLPSDPAVVVVVRGQCVTTYQLASKCPPGQADDSGVAGCLATADQASIPLRVGACR